MKPPRSDGSFGIYLYHRGMPIVNSDLLLILESLSQELGFRQVAILQEACDDQRI